MSDGNDAPATVLVVDGDPHPGKTPEPGAGREGDTR
jgi:hypothetical protein